ncbi:MAG: hypothetical protein ACKOPU_05595 [Candidatus Planktophila sp.]
MARTISVDHNIQLTNGKYLVIQENDDETISIASGYRVDTSDEDGKSHYIENDYYLISLTKDGVLVYTSSGMACHDLVEGIMQF